MIRTSCPHYSLTSRPPSLVPPRSSLTIDPQPFDLLPSVFVMFNLANRILVLSGSATLLQTVEMIRKYGSNAREQCVKRGLVRDSSFYSSPAIILKGQCHENFF